MDMYFALDMREGSLERIGGVWKVEMWKMFEGEEPWKIRLKAPVGAPETFVREVPTSGQWIDGFLAKKDLPLPVPERQPMMKTCFIRFG